MKWQPTVDFKIVLGEYGVQPVLQEPSVEHKLDDFPGMSKPKPKFQFKDRRGKKLGRHGKPIKRFT